MPYATIVKPGDKVDLSQIDPDYHAGLEKEEGKAILSDLADQLSKLQELLYASRMCSLLCVFQGLDTAGKDGAINRVLTYTNVQGCRTTGFKVPTSEEADHDFLWRIHPHAPRLGEVALFNRSHYEDVLVVRVHDLVPEKVWRKRYERINQFEQLLDSSNTVVLKFFLHISKQEQEERLLAREQDPLKSWKLSVGDWKERELWDKYMDAYEEALSECSTKQAPWHIVPANRKWFRDLAIAEAIRDALNPLKKDWSAQLAEMGEKAKAELEAFRIQTHP